MAREVGKVAMLGTVKNCQEKGYGFIVGEDNREYFFHMSSYRGSWHNLRNDVKAGTVRVSFDPDRKNNKGPRAENVTVIND